MVFQVTHQGISEILLSRIELLLKLGDELLCRLVAFFDVFEFFVLSELLVLTLQVSYILAESHRS